MYGVLSWRAPDRVAAVIRPKEARRLTTMALRWIVLGIGCGAVFLWAVQTTMPDLMPPKLWRIVWCLLGAHALVFLLLPVSSWCSCRGAYKQSITRSGYGDRSWRSFAAFELQSAPEVPDADMLVLYSRRNGRPFKLYLPDDEATRVRILRLVARYVPSLDACDDPDAVVQQVVDIPSWLKLTMALTTIGYAVAMGHVLSVTAKSADMLKILGHLLAAVGPATWLAWWWTRRHRRTDAWGWAFGFALMCLFLMTVLAVLWRP